ncbi:hypothetical protein [Helicobacter apodemus]|uniref:Autotransporter domain-containing protein n=1 Tax=Helicobacter apodemus TaxID=135569 RepID=A0A2U8FE93_9HELI|nr:hypothetical protein [Helicobacter apodemus]AWI34581.1 hypothetical protein CDV25_07260 [Helicobacter apodemus]
MSNKSFYVSPIINSGGGGKIMPHSTPIKIIKVNVKDYVLNLDFKSNVKTHSKFNLTQLDSKSFKSLKFNSLESNPNFNPLKSLKKVSLDSNPNFKTPKFLSLVCASILLTLPHTLVAKDNWITAVNSSTPLTTNDSNKNTLQSSITNTKVSATQNKEYKDLEIESNGSIINTDNNFAIQIQNNATIGSITNKGLISGSKSHNINITNKPTIESFSNSGSITNTQQRSFNVSQATIKTFNNSGLMQSGTTENVALYGTTIENFTNTGTIKGTGHINLRIQSFGSHTTITNFTNKGTIENTGTASNTNAPTNTAIDIGLATIQNLTNEGIIKGGRGVNVRASTIETIINKGTIEATGAHSQSGALVVFGEPSNKLTNIKTFINEGVLSSANSSGIVYTVGNSIETIINKGTIKAKDNAISVTRLFVSNVDAGKDNQKIGKIILEEGSSLESQKSAISIDIQDPKYNKKLELGGIEVKKGATLKSENGSAIAVAPNNQITGNIEIAGKIEAKTGISNAGEIQASITLSDEVKDFSVENTGNGNITGSIEAKDNVALSLTNSGNSSIGGSITSSSNAPLSITNTGSGSIGGSITASGNAPISITNSDNAKVAGNIEVSGDAPIVIKNEGNATLQSDIINSGSGNLSLSNTGNASIGANIKNNGSGSLSISNTGKVSDTTKIESNGSGKVEVEEWLVSTNSQGEVKPLEITGTNLSVVSVSNVTFDAGNITNLSSLVQDPKNVINIDTSQDTTISNPAEINSKVFAKAEFKTNDPSVNVNVDALSKTLSFSVDAAKTSAAALGKTLISNTQARANFVNAVMGNAMNAVNLIHNQGSANVYSNFNKAYEEGAIYANFDNLGSDALLRSSETKDKNHLAFMLPYISKSNTSLNGGLTSKGHTKGVIFGYSYLNPNNKDIYGIYGGYDDFSSKTYPSDILALNNRTYYAGVRYYHPFNYKDYELFSKFSSQFGLIQNDISERVGQTEFKGEPKSYAYDANVNMGINIKLNTKHTLTPEIGLGYNGGYSKAYTMSNAINTITRRNYTHKMNLFKTKTSLSFYSDWHKHFKTLVYAGVDWTMNPNVDNPKGRYSNIGYYGGGESKLDNLEYALGTTLVIPLNDAFYFSLNYGMNGTKNTTMHTGYGKFNYMW